MSTKLIFAPRLQIGISSIVSQIAGLIALFACTVVYAAAPAGAWWDGNYAYRQQVSIGAGGSALVTAYSVSVIFDHATQVSAMPSRSLASGNDVRVVYWNGTTWIELDRIVDIESPWNTAATRIWFETQAALAAGTTDDNYYVYYGYSGSSTPSSLTPLQNGSNIFLFYDDFSSAALDTTTRWTNSGATQAGGVLTVSNGAEIRSQSTFGINTIWEARARLSVASAPSGTFSYWGATSSNNTNFTSPYLRFSSTTIANHTATDSLAAPATQTFPPTSPTAYQRYGFTREGTTTARFLVNGTQVGTNFTHGASSTALRILLTNATAAGRTQQYEWARVRNYRNPEPTTSVALQQAFTPTALASYSFEETSWNGTAGEVLDSTANSLDGVARGAANTANASPAIAGATGTCRYATLNGTNAFVQVPNSAALNFTTAFGFAGWVRHRTNSYKAWEAMLTKGDSAYRMHLNGGCDITDTLAGNTTNGLNQGLNGGCTTADLNTNQVPAANTWYHLGGTFRNGEMRVYLNGNLMSSAAYSPPTIATNTFDLAIGENLQQTGRFWEGDIDEVTLWNQAVGQSTIQAHMAATHSCSVVPHFVIVTDGYGVNCAGETITVHVRDPGNNPITTYNQQVTLDTTTGRGDWTLVTGSGTLTNGPTANDGIATYQWPLGESQAVFSLSYREGAASTPITVYQTNTPAIRDDATDPAIAWSPSGFTVTSAPLGIPPPGVIPPFASPQVAGTAFTAYITAYGTTPTDAQCGVIEAYAGAKNLKFWSTYVNPNTGTRVVTIDGGNIATSEGAAAAQAVTFINGQASVTTLYRDAGLMNIAMKDDTTGNPSLPTGIRGSTGNIVFRPATFVLSNIRRTSDNVANPAASNGTGPIFMTAGQSISATVTALESGGLATLNFGRESTPESVALTSAVVLPAGGQSSAIAATTGFGAFVSGVASGTDFTWPEVGIMTLTAHIRDSDYLGAGDVFGTTSGNVGRFIPASFGVTMNVPLFQTACAASGFTYIGQSFTYATAPVVSLTARALGGTTTRNYTGAFFKLTNASLTARTYASGSGVLNVSGLPPIASDPTIADLTNGLASLTFSAGTGLAMTRSVPVVPFNANLISLAINVIDSDGVTAANPITFNNIAFNGSSEQRYGRIAFRNVVGSELLNLPVPMRTEFFSSAVAGFVNSNDSCTNAVSVSLTNFGGNLTAGETCVIDTGDPGASGAGCAVAGVAGQRFSLPPTAGDFITILRAPGSGNNGTATISTVVPSWLRFDWDTTIPLEENPSAVINFGLFKGEAKRIFQIEK